MSDDEIRFIGINDAAEYGRLYFEDGQFTSKATPPRVSRIFFRVVPEAAHGKKIDSMELDYE